MWDKEGWQSVVVVGIWLVGDAKRAVCQDVRAIGQVEATGVQGGETGFKPLVRFSEGGTWAYQTETGKENVIRGLQPGGCDGENVFR